MNSAITGQRRNSDESELLVRSFNSPSPRRDSRDPFLDNESERSRSDRDVHPTDDIETPALRPGSSQPLNLFRTWPVSRSLAATPLNGSVSRGNGSGDGDSTVYYRPIRRRDPSVGNSARSMPTPIVAMTEPNSPAPNAVEIENRRLNVELAAARLSSQHTLIEATNRVNQIETSFNAARTNSEMSAQARHEQIMAEQQQAMKQRHKQILVEHQKTIASLQALA